MLDAPHRPLRAVRPAPVPVEAMLLGQRAEDAADLLPRLFSLCRAAQGAAARLALGLGGGPDSDALSREVRRDHLLKLCVTWPGFFRCAPSPLPANWAEGGQAVARAVYGPAGTMPATLADFRAWLSAGTGIAPSLALVAGCFRPGEATAPGLPLVDDRTAFAAVAVENSVAARVAGHPLLTALAAESGRGPLWRAAARAVDLEAALADRLPRARATTPGHAVVPAARGLYAVSARVAEGRVAAFHRVTPTDHLLAPGGVLDRSLASLPADRGALAPLVLDILDPCTPVRLEDAPDA